MLMGMIIELHVYVVMALAMASLFPSKFSYKSCWFFPFILLGRFTDYAFEKEFH